MHKKLSRQVKNWDKEHGPSDGEIPPPRSEMNIKSLTLTLTNGKWRVELPAEIAPWDIIYDLLDRKRIPKDE